MHIAAPSGAPLRLRNTGVTATSISLDWDLPLLRDRNGIITSYRVNLTATEDSSVRVFIVTNSRIGVTSLHPYYTYSCQVQAVTAEGRGPYSSPISVRTLQDGQWMKPIIGLKKVLRNVSA